MPAKKWDDSPNNSPSSHRDLCMESSAPLLSSSYLCLPSQFPLIQEPLRVLWMGNQSRLFRVHEAGLPDTETTMLVAKFWTIEVLKSGDLASSSGGGRRGRGAQNTRTHMCTHTRARTHTHARTHTRTCPHHRVWPPSTCKCRKISHVGIFSSKDKTPTSKAVWRLDRGSQTTSQTTLPQSQEPLLLFGVVEINKLKKESHLMTRENHMKSKFQRPQVKLYWNTIHSFIYVIVDFTPNI